MTAELPTLTLNTMTLIVGIGGSSVFDRLSTPNVLQSKVVDLFGLKPKDIAICSIA